MTLAKIIAVLTALCIVISEISVNTDRWHLPAYLGDLRDKFANSYHTTADVSKQPVDNTFFISFTPSTHFDDFTQAITARADEDRCIILSMTDEAFIDMAINFYEFSLRAHHIDNFLFVGVGRNTCKRMSRLSIPCFYYADDPNAGKPSDFLQHAFNRKVNIRNNMILEALVANFTVIHTDPDVAFLANPVQQLKVNNLSVNNLFAA